MPAFRTADKECAQQTCFADKLRCPRVLANSAADSVCAQFSVVTAFAARVAVVVEATSG